MGIIIFWVFHIITSLLQSSVSKILFPNTTTLYENHFGRCRTPNGGENICVYLHDCKPLLALFEKVHSNKHEKLYLRQSQCGHFDGKVLVCCPSKSDALLSLVNQPLKADHELLPDPGTCGEVNLHKVYGGVRTRIDEFPWVAQLEYTKLDNSKGYHCAGALITNKHVVTASHCVNGAGLPRSWNLTGVRLGEWNKSSPLDCEFDFCADPVVDIPIKRVLPHELYKQNSLDQLNDIALLVLAKEVKFTHWIKPICLPLAPHLRKSSFRDVELQISGWGKTETDSSSNVKLKAELKAVSIQACKAVYEKFNIIVRRTQICAGGDNGVDSCRGDSGGPLMAIDHSSKGQSYYYLVGITSYGPTPCGLHGWPGVYTKITAYLGWIKSKLMS